MKKSCSLSGICAGACLVAFAAGAAEAQQASASASEPQEVAWATGPEEIVVTAQKRSQNLRDVSLSITAIGGDALVSQRIADIRDMAARIPNMTVGTYLGQAQIVMRGIGNTSVFTGADPSVVLHLDGAVIAQPQAQLGAMFDLERIEALRGPQGTLYGRNATGGVVNLVARKPTEETTGYVYGTVGNYNLIATEAALSGSLVPDLIRARVAVKTEDHSGYGINEFTGKGIDNAHRTSARAQIQFLPSPDFDILLGVDWTHEDDANYGPKFRAVSYPGTTIPQLLPLGADGFPANPHRNINSDIDNVNLRKGYAFNGTVNWKLGDGFALKSISNYRHFKADNLWDYAVSPAKTNSASNAIEVSKTYSEELELSYMRGPLSVSASGYYFHETLDGDNRIGMNPSIRLPFAQQQVFLRFKGRVRTDSYAAFINGDYRLSSAFNLNFGARYTVEKRSGALLTTVGPTTTPFNTERTSKCPPSAPMAQI